MRIYKGFIIKVLTESNTKFYRLNDEENNYWVKNESIAIKCIDRMIKEEK